MCYNLLEYILQWKKWSDVGIDGVYGLDNIDSISGTTYYGLLLPIMSGGDIIDDNITTFLQKIKEFYTKSGYMNNTPAVPFKMYLKIGVGANISNLVNKNIDKNN